MNFRLVMKYMFHTSCYIFSIFKLNRPMPLYKQWLNVLILLTIALVSSYLISLIQKRDIWWVDNSIENVKDELIKIPRENIIFFCTANLGGGYSGTNDIDEALFDRF